MVSIYTIQRWKRRAKSEWEGLTVIARRHRTETKIIQIIYETTRILYNPWRIFDLAFKNVLS